MSLASPNATGLPDRRRILSTIAAAGALGLPALPALAASGDAHLFSLGRTLAQLDALAEEADRQLSAVSAVYDRAMPDVTPEALFVRPDDDFALRSWPEMRKGKTTGRRFYGPADIETAEASLGALDALPDELPNASDPRTAAKLARLREIVESYTSLRDAKHAAWLSCGMEEVERAAEAAHDRCESLRWQIIECPASTIAGVLLKAQAATSCFGDTIEEAASHIVDQIEDAAGEGLAYSILRDLVRIANRNAIGGHDA